MPVLRGGMVDNEGTFTGRWGIILKGEYSYP